MVCRPLTIKKWRITMATTIYMPGKLSEEVDKFASEIGFSRSKLISTAVEIYMKEYKNNKCFGGNKF